jgi:hypothetical protein
LVCLQYQTLIFSTRSLEKPVLNGWAFSANSFKSPNLVPEIIEGDSLEFARAKLTANFGTELDPVDHLNGIFEKVLGVDDGSALKHAQAVSARKGGSAGGPLSNLHLEIVPDSAPFRRLPPGADCLGRGCANRSEPSGRRTHPPFQALHHGGSQKRARSRMSPFFLIFAARIASL